MNTTKRSTVVGVFDTRADADRAVSELRAAGFANDQIGIAGREAGDGDGSSTDAEEKGENSLGGAATGAAIGAGAGGLIALGILSGIIPGIGPAIAAGTLGMLVSNMGLGAAAVGIAGALAGLGMSDDDAKHYEGEFRSGRTIVTVNDPSGRAWTILQANGGYSRQSPRETASV